jgi:hypothetical protein
MVEAPDNSAAVAALNRARDMAAQQEQGFPRLVYSLDGYVYECMSGIADALVDLEPRPQREQPNSRIGFAVTDAEGQRTAVLRRLDLIGTFNPPQFVYHRAEDGSLAACQVPGLLAGIAPQHLFQVVYAGRDRWVVGGGDVTNYSPTPAVSKSLDDATVTIADGWVCLEVDWQIEGELDLVLRNARIAGRSSLQGTLGFRFDSEGEPVWTSGTCLYPIARVQSPTGGQRPFISQIWQTAFHFGGAGFPAGPRGPAARSIG